MYLGEYLIGHPHRLDVGSKQLGEWMVLLFLKVDSVRWKFQRLQSGRGKKVCVKSGGDLRVGFTF